MTHRMVFSSTLQCEHVRVRACARAALGELEYSGSR